jgi:Xaa-Pro aminopeptidase
MDYLRRQHQIRGQLQRARLDLLLVTHMPNVRYLCGFTGSAGVLAVGAGRPVLFTDGRYTEQARTEAQNSRVVVSQRSPLQAVARWLGKHRLRTVGVEGERMTLAARAALRRLLPPRLRLRATAGLVECARMVKEAEEIAFIGQAVGLGASLLGTALKTIRPGVLESDVAAELEYQARRAGAEGMSFETIVAAGPRSALPHGRATAQPIPARGFVILDFGVILHGYCSDMTRTLYVGRPGAEDRRLYQSVREAQQAATEVVRAGVRAGQVDRAARQVLGRAGFARYFTHSTGHGVGLEIHEPPRLGRGQRDVLQPGMVITIEPGAYLPGRGGVRIEDMAVVTQAGCDVLTPVPKELIVL